MTTNAVNPQLSANQQIGIAKVSPAKRSRFINALRQQSIDITNPEEAEAKFLETLKEHFGSEVSVSNPKNMGLVYRVSTPDGELITSHSQLQTFMLMGTAA